MFWLFIIILIILIFKNFLAIFRIKKTLKFLSNHSIFKFEKNSIAINLPKIIIVLPAFNETETIEKSVKYFSTLYNPYSDGAINILIITNQKENENIKEPSTLTMAKRLIEKYDNLKLLHYPYIYGNKADQINYVVNNLKFIYPSLKLEDIFLAIYDVDSRPSHDTLKTFFSILKSNPNGNIFQQSAIFFSNFHEFKGPLIKRIFLKAAAVEQTRFTLAHEIPRIRREYKYCTTNLGLLNSITYAHCVGHGLIIRASYLSQNKFPSNYYPEDMFYGFIVSALKEPIIPLPVLDNSEMPLTIKSLFAQRAAWFLGPALGEKYRRYVKNQFYDIYRKDKLRISALSIYATLLAVKWALSSFICFLMLFLLIFSHNLIISILVLLFFLSYICSFYLILKNYKILWEMAGGKEDKPKLIESLLISVFSIPYLLFHGIPAYYASLKILTKRVITKKE